MPSADLSHLGPAAPSPRQVAALFKRLGLLYPGHPLDNDPAQPFQVLVATILSARTKDPVTNAAMRRLWEAASGLPVTDIEAGLDRPSRVSRSAEEGGAMPAARRQWPLVTPQMLLALTEKQIAELIFPVGFYQTKARHLRQMSAVLLEKFGGQVPSSREELLGLAGVGRKVANLLLNICWDVPAICVDIHVHRISNRLGWVSTTTPEQTEQALMQIVPQRYWSTLNRVLVNHGQQVCQPSSPWCSRCSLADSCPRLGVVHSR